MTLESLYPEWLNYYKVHTTKTASVKRYSTEWTRYYISDPIIKKPLKSLTKLMLDEWVHNVIQRHHMTKKQYYTMSFIIRNCMSYAEENGYLQENVFAKVKVNAKMFRKVQKKPDYTQVYLAHEQPLIIDEAWKDYNKNPENTTPLAVILMFYLAVRPGEIVALQESDFAAVFCLFSEWNPVNLKKSNRVNIPEFRVALQNIRKQMQAIEIYRS